MSVENSMVVGAQDEYDNLNREPTVCERRMYRCQRAEFISRLLMGEPATAKNGITFDLGDVWDLMPPDFYSDYTSYDNDYLNELYLSGKMGKWAEATQIAAGKLADHAGYEV